MSKQPKKQNPKKLDPANGPLVKKWKAMLKHFEKHAPKKPDETSEFRLHFDYLTGEPL